MPDDPQIVRMQLDRLRSMSPEERLRIAGELTEAVEALAMAGIRADHPQADDREVFLRLAIRKLGYAQARQVYPDIDALPDAGG